MIEKELNLFPEWTINEIGEIYKPDGTSAITTLIFNSLFVYLKNDKLSGLFPEKRLLLSTFVSPPKYPYFHIETLQEKLHYNNLKWITLEDYLTGDNLDTINIPFIVLDLVTDKTNYYSNIFEFIKSIDVTISVFEVVKSLNSYNMIPFLNRFLFKYYDDEAEFPDKKDLVFLENSINTLGRLKFDLFDLKTKKEYLEINFDRVMVITKLAKSDLEVQLMVIENTNNPTFIRDVFLIRRSKTKFKWDDVLKSYFKSYHSFEVYDLESLMLFIVDDLEMLETILNKPLTEILTYLKLKKCKISNRYLVRYLNDIDNDFLYHYNLNKLSKNEAPF